MIGLLGFRMSMPEISLAAEGDFYCDAWSGC